MKIIGTNEIVKNIPKTIRGSKQFLCIVSPFLDIDDHYLNLIKQKANSGIKVIVICGKTALKKIELFKLNSINNLELYFCISLHAKFFFNQDYAVMSSMNLYKASEDNFEVGVLLSKKYDERAYDDLGKRFYELLNKSSKYRQDIYRK